MMLAFATRALAADAPVTIVPKFAENQPRYLTVRQQTEKTTVVSFFPDPIAALDQRDWWIVATLDHSSATGPTALTWLLDRLQALHRDRVGREQKPDLLFDSLRPSNPPQAAGLATWSNRSLLLRFDAAGKLVDAADAPTTQRSPVNTYGTSVELPTIADMRHLAAELYSSYLPGKPVAVGDEWTGDYRVHRAPYGLFSGSIRYTLRTLDTAGNRPIARIEFAGNLTLTPDPATTRAAGDTRRHEVRRASYVGNVEFDLDLGQPLSFESNERIDLNLVMSTSQPAAKPTTQTTTTTSQPATESKPMSFSFQMSESRKCSATFSSTPPVKPIVVRPPAATQAAAPRTPISSPPSPATQPGTRLIPPVPATTTRPTPQPKP